MAILSIDTLMKLDRKLVEEIPTKEVRAKHLSKIMGKDVSVKIKALSGETYIGLLATATNKKGNVDPAKTYKAQTLIVVEAMQEPSLKDKELQSHFRCCITGRSGADSVPRRRNDLCIWGGGGALWIWR